MARVLGAARSQALARHVLTTRAVRPLASWTLPLLAGALVLATFSPVLDGTFLNWDDDRSLLTNPAFRGVGLAQLRWMFTTTLLGHYAPLTWLSFGVTYALAGMSPWAYHLGNLLLHALNTVLVYRLAQRLLATAREDAPHSMPVCAGALLSALLFGLHPLRVESVGWITDRGDVLCGTFYLLALLAYLRAVHGGGGRWRALSLAAFAGALLSKEIAVTLPLTLLLLDAYPLRRWSSGWRPLLVEKVPYLLASGIGAGLALFARSQGASLTSVTEYGVGTRLALVAYSLAFYPLKFFWPTSLSPLYELPQHPRPLDARFVLAGLAVAVVTGGLVALRQRLPGALVAWLHAAIVVAPVSGLVHAGSQLVADRYSYLGGLGFAALIGGGLAWVIERRAGADRRPPAGVAVAVAMTVVVAVMATTSWRLSWHWRDSVSVWRAAVAVDADCVLCQSKLGTALLAANEPGLAEAHLRRAVELAPARSTLHIDLGVALALVGRDVEAERGFREAIRLTPGSLVARRNLAVLYTRQKRPADAVAVLQEAVRLSPDDPGLLVSLGHLLVGQGSPREAAAVLERAVAAAPAAPDVRVWLARAYLAAGEVEQAAPHIAAIERLDPTQAAALRRELGDPSSRSTTPR